MAPTGKRKRESQRSRLAQNISKKQKASLAAKGRWAKRLDQVCRDLEQSDTTTSLPDEFTPRPSTSSSIVEDESTGNKQSGRPSQSNTRLSDLEKSLQLTANLGVDIASSKYCLVDINSIKSLIESLACPQCKQLSLTLNTSKRTGFALKFEVNCTYCIKVTENFSSEQRKTKL